MVNEKKKKTRAQKDTEYKIFYSIGFSIVCCIGFLGSSIFTYDLFAVF